MSTWPSADMILINRGRIMDKDLSGSVAVRADLNDPEFGYYVMTGEARGFSVTPDTLEESIDAWEPVTPVPTRLIKKIKRGRNGSKVSASR